MTGDEVEAVDVLRLYTPLDSEHFLEGVFIPALDFEGSPFSPELLSNPWITKLRCMAVDLPCSIDFPETSFHLGELEAHFLGLIVWYLPMAAPRARTG